MLLDETLGDSLGLADAAVTAMMFELWPNDALSPTDRASLEADLEACAIDNLTAFDNTLLAITCGRFAGSAVLVTDATTTSALRSSQSSDVLLVGDVIVAGLEKSAVASETLVCTETWAVAVGYSRDPVDMIAHSDDVYPWANGSLSVQFNGDSSLVATAVNRVAPSGLAPVVPPRTQALPRPPAGSTSHFVVNPTPPRRQ